MVDLSIATLNYQRVTETNQPGGPTWHLHGSLQGRPNLDPPLQHKVAEVAQQILNSSIDPKLGSFRAYPPYPNC